eukprot:6101982-Pleurochrysis_carterae.AAC.5
MLHKWHCCARDGRLLPSLTRQSQCGRFLRPIGVAAALVLGARVQSEVRCERSVRSQMCAKHAKLALP